MNVAKSEVCVHPIRLTKHIAANTLINSKPGIGVIVGTGLGEGV
ncbi:hypothetical protein C5S53_14515 [Methanophagales archaeon]|jgi:hypothetical protein|nr:hypothetical protein C5S53_14515 [Methanophagales archaeon]